MKKKCIYIQNDLAVPLMRTVSGQKAFFDIVVKLVPHFCTTVRERLLATYCGTKVWNKFNDNIKEAPSVYSFKSRLRQLGYENL